MCSLFAPPFGVCGSIWSAVCVRAHVQLRHLCIENALYIQVMWGHWATHMVVSDS